MILIGLFYLLKPIGKYFSIQDQCMNGPAYCLYGWNLEISQFSTSYTKALSWWIIFYHFVCHLVSVNGPNQTWITIIIKWKVTPPFLFFWDWTHVPVGWYRFIFWKRHQSTIRLGFVVYLRKWTYLYGIWAMKSYIIIIMMMMNIFYW